MSTGFSLKDHLFNETKIRVVAQQITDVFPEFKTEKFVQQVVSRFPQLELKARMSWIAESLHDFLPSDYPDAVAILLKALPPPNNPELTDNDYGDFIYAPWNEFVARYGCSQQHLEMSLAALYEITQRFSAEDAIRRFINAFPTQTLKKLKLWVTDTNYHVRRLCSEGTRPKLPWSAKIFLTADDTIPLLDVLHADRTRYVTRSVANHLNDLAKSQPTLVIETLLRWQKSSQQKPEEMAYLTRHSLRTLIKQGHPEALALVGYGGADALLVSDVKISAKVMMNDFLEFSFVIKASEETAVLCDYVIHFCTKKGDRTSKKVFKLTTLQLKAGETITLSKRHRLRQFMTTRTLYPGKHTLEIQVNGVNKARVHFELKTKHALHSHRDK